MNNATYRLKTPNESGNTALFESNVKILITESYNVISLIKNNC